MKKKFFMGMFITFSVLLLIVAFENILTAGNFLFLFFTVQNSFLMIFLSGLLGFLVGFFLMLYAFEVKKLKMTQEEEDMNTADKATDVEKAETAVTAEELAADADAGEESKESNDDMNGSSVDSFDDDEEVLG
jgi:hypothetical protein